jgi:hypothetical protein
MSKYDLSYLTLAFATLESHIIPACGLIAMKEISTHHFMLGTGIYQPKDSILATYCQFHLRVTLIHPFVVVGGLLKRYFVPAHTASHYPSSIPRSYHVCWATGYVRGKIASPLENILEVVSITAWLLF